MYASPYQPCALVDISTEAWKVLKVTDGKRINQWEYLYQAEGKILVTFEIEGRSLSAFTKLQLQYLLYGLKGGTPPEDYGQLVSDTLTSLRTVSTDETPLNVLIERVGEKWCDPTLVRLTAPPVTLAVVPSVKSLEKPMKGITALVWKIADDLYSKNGNVLPNRHIFIEMCTARGINQATAGTQFAKWKKSKGI